MQGSYLPWHVLMTFSVHGLFSIRVWPVLANICRSNGSACWTCRSSKGFRDFRYLILITRFEGNVAYRIEINRTLENNKQRICCVYKFVTGLTCFLNFENVKKNTSRITDNEKTRRIKLDKQIEFCNELI